jgi:hypothetical protein
MEKVEPTRPAHLATLFSGMPKLLIISGRYGKTEVSANGSANLATAKSSCVSGQAQQRGSVPDIDIGVHICILPQSFRTLCCYWASNITSVPVVSSNIAWLSRRYPASSRERSLSQPFYLPGNTQPRG